MIAAIGSTRCWYVSVHISTAGEDAFLYVRCPYTWPEVVIKTNLECCEKFITDGDSINWLREITRKEAIDLDQENNFDNAFLLFKL